MSPAFATANLLDSPEFVVGTVSLIVVLLGGAVVIGWLDRWRKIHERRGVASTESLTHFRGLFERGEISEEEYKRIRDKVSNRMRQEVGLPATASAPPVEPDRPAEPAKPPDPAP